MPLVSLPELSMGEVLDRSGWTMCSVWDRKVLLAAVPIMAGEPMTVVTLRMLV